MVNSSVAESLFSWRQAHVWWLPHLVRSPSSLDVYDLEFSTLDRHSHCKYLHKCKQQPRENQSGDANDESFSFFSEEKIVDGCIFSSALSSFLHQKSLKFIFLVHEEEEEEQERMFVVSFQCLYPLLGYNYCVFQRDWTIQAHIQFRCFASGSWSRTICQCIFRAVRFDGFASQKLGRKNRWDICCWCCC